MNTNQQGKVSGVLVGLIAAVVLAVALIIVIVGSYASANTYGANTEASLRAAQKDSLNVFAQAGQKIREVAQVPKMYADDVARVTREAIENRYGEDGSKAAFQWLQEQNPQLDSSIYAEVNQVIKSGRRDFENAQRRQIDVQRQYEAALGSTWRGWWLKQAGYPKEDLSKFAIVSTAEADEVFRTKQEAGPIQLR